MECSICFNFLNDNAMSTLCGHIFCDSCIKQCNLANNSCPTCGTNVNLKDVHKIFLPAIATNNNGDPLDMKLALRVNELEVLADLQKKKLTEFETKLNQISTNYCKIDADNEKIVKQNRELKQELEKLKDDIILNKANEALAALKTQ